MHLYYHNSVLSPNIFAHQPLGPTVPLDEAIMSVTFFSVAFSSIVFQWSVYIFLKYRIIYLLIKKIEYKRYKFKFRNEYKIQRTGNKFMRTDDANNNGEVLNRHIFVPMERKRYKNK